MSTKKWKFIAAGLVLVILILCMMTFYLNSSNRNLLIQLNRMDREKAEMQRDYEKLYSAYYSYDKKILKILESNPNVFWAEDSSAYCIYDKKTTTALFAFYKKPRMQDEYFLWPYEPGKCWDPSGDNVTSVFDLSRLNWRVDSIKPNQFILFKTECELVQMMVSKKDDESGGRGNPITIINFK